MEFLDWCSRNTGLAILGAFGVMTMTGIVLEGLARIVKAWRGK